MGGEQASLCSSCLLSSASSSLPYSISTLLPHLHFVLASTCYIASSHLQAVTTPKPRQAWYSSSVANTAIRPSTPSTLLTRAFYFVLTYFIFLSITSSFVSSVTSYIFEEIASFTPSANNRSICTFFSLFPKLRVRASAATLSIRDPSHQRQSWPLVRST